VLSDEERDESGRVGLRGGNRLRRWLCGLGSFWVVVRGLFVDKMYGACGLCLNPREGAVVYCVDGEDSDPGSPPAVTFTRDGPRPWRVFPNDRPRL
jgi:hypothetical protein